MKILEAAIKKRSSKLQKNTIPTDTKEKLDQLFHKATTENDTTTATKELTQAHAELHKQSPPPISP